MKLEIIDKISFKRFIDKEDNDSSKSSSSNFDSIIKSNHLSNNDMKSLRDNIIDSLHFIIDKKPYRLHTRVDNDSSITSTITSSSITTPIVSNTSNNNNNSNNNVSLLDIYYIESFSRETNINNIKILQFPLSNIHFTIDYYDLTDKKLISSMITLFILLLKQEFNYNTLSSVHRILPFNYIINTLDKEELLPIIEYMSNKNKNFPSQGMMYTMVKVDMYSRLYSNDLGFTFHLDFNISEFLSIENIHTRYINLSNDIKKYKVPISNRINHSSSNSNSNCDNSNTSNCNEKRNVNNFSETVNNNNTTDTTIDPVNNFSNRKSNTIVTTNTSISKNIKGKKGKNCKSKNSIDNSIENNNNNNTTSTTVTTSPTTIEYINRYPRRCKKRKFNE